MTDLVGEYVAHLKTIRRSKATVEGYGKLLRRMDADMPAGVAVATLDELKTWIFTEKRGDSTVGHYVTIVKGFGKWATDPKDQRLEFHHAEDLPDIGQDSREIGPATEAEWAVIAGNAEEPFADWYNLAGRAGLRSIEVASFKRENMTEKWMHVYGKGGKWRRVPTNPHLWQRFKDRPEGTLARDRRGLEVTEQQVSASGRYHLHRMGLHLSMHQLRKRFATKVYDESGHNARLVQKLLGHANLAQTQKYLGVDDEEAAEIVGGLDMD